MPRAGSRTQAKLIFGNIRFSGHVTKPAEFPQHYKELRSDSAMKWHIAATPRCKHAWEKDILASNSNTIQKPNITDMEVDEVGSSNLNSWDDLQDFVFDPSPELASPSK